MKKIIVLMLVLFGVSMVAHAVTSQNDTQQSTGSSVTNDTGTQAQQPTNDNADQVGGGSGDDADTANDKDPEADQNSGQ